MKAQRGEGMLDFHPYFDIQQNFDGTGYILPLRKFLGIHLCLSLNGPQGY